jgi:hypothetical protein
MIELTYTSELPVKPGPYWLQWGAAFGQPEEICTITYNHDIAMAIRMYHNDPCPVTHVIFKDARWAGPIPNPLKLKED